MVNCNLKGYTAKILLTAFGEEQKYYKVNRLDSLRAVEIKI